MPHFADLTECDYFGAEHARVLRAVGWLAIDKPFATGRTAPEPFAKLKDLLDDPWQPMVFMGIHDCELCQFDPAHGHTNLFIPHGSVIFVCPELIVHYIATHHYRPPDEFFAALADCPNTRSIQYKKKFLDSGGRTLVPKTG